MLTVRLGDMGCLAEGVFALNVSHFTTGLPGLDCLTIKCTKEVKIILPVPYGKEKKRTTYGVPTVCQAPHWGCLKAGKSCALVVFTKDNALFSLQLVLWQISLPLRLSSHCSGEGSLSSAHLLWHTLYLFWLQCLVCVLDKGQSHNLHPPFLRFLYVLEMKLIFL